MDVDIEMESLSIDPLEFLKYNNNGTYQQQRLRKYWWNKIHLVAKIVDPHLLKEVTEDLDVTELNALTVFSENALHVLLEYGKPLPVCTVRISKGDISKPCHIIPTEQPAMVECVKILVDAGIDINHNNFWNETPILVALKYRYWETIGYLLECSEITCLDLDTCKDPHTGKTARELLKSNQIDVDTLPVYADDEHKNKRLLFTYLKSNDEEAFLNFNGGNIKRFVNCFDGSIYSFQASGTMLELCFRKAFFEYKQATNNRDDDGDIYETSMLKAFCLNTGLVRCIRHLLENGADFTTRNPRSNESIIEAVVSRGYYPLLVLLLHHNTDVPVDIIFGLIKRRPSNNYVLLLLLSKLEMLQMERKVSALECNRGLRDFMLYDQGAAVCNKCFKLGGPLLGSGVLRANEAELNEYLDDIVDAKHYKIRCDGLVTDSSDRYCEFQTLYLISTLHKKQELLLHPAIRLFIRTKWKRMRWYFYVDIFFYMLLWFVLFLHIVLHVDDLDTTTTVYILEALLAIDLLKEVTEMALCQLDYLKDTSNYIEIIVIVCSIIMIASKDERAAVLAILGASMNPMIVHGQLPSLMKCIMFLGTPQHFFDYAVFYIILFLSFAVCFALVYPSKEDNVFFWVFQTVIFFTGGFNDDVLHPEKFPIFGRLLMIAFVFSMTIFLSNLLIGLIVTDMDQLQKMGKLYEQIKIVKFFKKLDMIIELVKPWVPCERLIRHINIFQPGQPKILKIIVPSISIFNEEDWKILFDLQEKQKEKSHEKVLLSSLYDHIMNKIANSNEREITKNRRLFEKLEKIEENVSRLLRVFDGGVDGDAI